MAVAVLAALSLEGPDPGSGVTDSTWMAVIVVG